MDLSTYAGLKDAIAMTAMRTGDTEFEAAVPSFIRFAELRMSRHLRTRHNEAATTVSIVDGVGALPTDYAQFRSLSLNGSLDHTLEAVDASYLTFADPAGQAGTPRFFAIQGDTILTAPKYTGDLVLVYFRKVPALSDASPTNWALQEFPDLYLYGALIEGAPFMLDDQRVGVWGTMYENAMNAANGDDQLARYSNTAVRVRSATP